MTYDRWCILNDELWDLRGRAYDIEDEQVGILINRLCSMMQEILSYIPKEDNDD